jgi:hypothetical protein
LSKTLFPEWAPDRLVENYYRMKKRADDTRKFYDEMDGDEFELCCSEGRCSGGRAIEAAERDKLINILFRLLTDLNMETVWSTILTQTPLNTNPISNRLRVEPEISLWNTIDTAFKAFRVQISKSRTTAQKHKDLMAISAKTKILLDAIAKDPVATEMARRVTAYYLAQKNIEWRESEGETPSWYEYEMPMTLQSDCDEAWREIREYDDAYMEDDYLWHKRPLLERLRDWAQEAEKIDLVDLLQLFVNWIELEAQQPQEIKHPGRGESALRPFLIRRINKHMMWFYGQPLDEAVAQIVTTILELNIPLTRDDVRPYILEREDFGEK